MRVLSFPILTQLQPSFTSEDEEPRRKRRVAHVEDTPRAQER